jgi:dolichol-phosphate mannosyltransferase
MAAGIDLEARAEWEVPAHHIQTWRPRRHRRCVVIPVINEGARIANLLFRMDALGVADFADVVIVDGGSTDGSLDPGLLSSKRVRALIVKTGPGRLGAQLRCAYAHALEEGYSEIVTIDGNDKDDPEAISRIFAALEGGADFVQASRFLAGGVEENTPMVRSLAIRLVHAPMLSLFSGFRWTDTTQGFRGYRARMLLDPRLAIFRDVFSRYELLAYLSYRAPRLGYRCLEIPSARRYPAGGKVPTNIAGLRANLSLLRTLVYACLGRYDPRDR